MLQTPLLARHGRLRRHHSGCSPDLQALPTARFFDVCAGSASGIPILGVIVIFGVYISEEQDEFLRTVMMQKQPVGHGHRFGPHDVLGFCGRVHANGKSSDVLGLYRVVRSVWLSATFGAAEAPMKNRLKVLRAERNWSQADLADRLKVSRQSVNAIETGKFDPSLPLAFRLARLFETTIEQLFTDGETELSDHCGLPNSLFTRIIHPSLVSDPVHFPRLPSILRKRLFEMGRVRRNFRPDKSYVNRFAVHFFLIHKTRRVRF